ncbi:MAG: hypothetical protein Ct9H300mP14_16320 [Gammaproteobacteria bacterium]|nr:MAG: hypothetical protein Ct9H300mP14_16320 [Gammaproteobacteria bacterium]
MSTKILWTSSVTWLGEKKMTFRIEDHGVAMRCFSRGLLGFDESVDRQRPGDGVRADVENRNGAQLFNTWCLECPTIPEQ